MFPSLYRDIPSFSPTKLLHNSEHWLTLPRPRYKNKVGEAVYGQGKVSQTKVGRTIDGRTKDVDLNEIWTFLKYFFEFRNCRPPSPGCPLPYWEQQLSYNQGSKESVRMFNFEMWKQQKHNKCEWLKNVCFDDDLWKQNMGDKHFNCVRLKNNVFK